MVIPPLMTGILIILYIYINPYGIGLMSLSLTVYGNVMGVDRLDPIALIRYLEATRWAPTSYKWSYKPYKWPYNWVTGVITL